MPYTNVDYGGALNPYNNGNLFKEFMNDAGPESGCSTLSSCSLTSSSELSSGGGKVKTDNSSEDMGTSKYELEDYIYEMECRQSSNRQPDDETQDIYARLAQKEQDLILAAELGKALLERNEILVHQNEKLAEDYSRKLEVLEQEKHSLRRKFLATEGEYEVKIQELAVDLQCSRDEHDDLQDNFKQTDREKGHVLEELTEQNQRLSNKLKESSKKEDQMNQHIKSLTDQFSLRKSNMSDQISTLEVLRDEIILLTERKLDLEKRIDDLSSEREGLSVTLDESTDRIVLLEKKSKEKELLLRNSQRDLEDLRHTNLSLTDRLEAISRNSSSLSMGHTSLMNEMDLSDQEARPSLPEDLLELDEDIECDEPILPHISDSESLKQLQHEVVETNGKLRTLIDQMRYQRRNSSTSLSTNSSDELNFQNLKLLPKGMLANTVQELTGVVRQLLHRSAKGQCSNCGQSGEKDQKMQMEKNLHDAMESLDKFKIELADSKDKLKLKTDEAANLEQQMILKDAEMKAVVEEKENLKHDLSNTHLAKDELIKKAWDMRDNAVSRKNACEIELARTRIDVMQVNSQLMEAIQQKVELAQQLEQWQVDMQQLLDDQMKRKLDRLENSEVFNTKFLNNSDSDSSCSARNSPKRNSYFLALLSHLRRSPSNNNSNSANK